MCRKSAIEADWDADRRLAVVRSFKGNINSQMGRHVNGKAYLLPEEAWHLMMRGTLLLYLNGVPLHPQDALPLVLDLKDQSVWQRQMVSHDMYTA